MKINIVIIGLNYEYNLDISNMLADKTGMFLLDVNQYLNYSLLSRKNMEEVCGIEYLESQENAVIKSCAEFENSVICMPAMYFLRNEQYKNFDRSVIIYIRHTKPSLEKVNDTQSQYYSALPVDLINFKDRDSELKSISYLTVNVTNKKKDTIVKEILTRLGGDS